MTSLCKPRAPIWACLLVAGLALQATAVSAVEAPWQRLPAMLGDNGGEPLPYRAAMTRFYAERNYRPLWFGSVVPVPASHQLVSLLEQADIEGLDPEAYEPDALRQDCLEGVPEDPAACELRLTSAFLQYAGDVRYGARRARDVDVFWHFRQGRLDASGLLRRLASSDDPAALFDTLPPKHVQYLRLREALADYRRLPREWFTLPDGPSLRPGERGKRVLALRERLGVEMPLLFTSDEPDYFDDVLRLVVESFQERHGLKVDGIVGPRTRAALNVSVEERIAQVQLNMERWRWLAGELPPSHILVNLAGFNLSLTVEGREALQMRSISGRPDRSSPSFRSEITELIFNPGWTVPHRLAVEDMLPLAQRDASALARRNISVLARKDGKLVEVKAANIDWQSLGQDDFPYVLHQRSGPHNSLGRLKFDMPNPYSIYLHDTPHKSLFHRTNRAFSSGCIRVERPLELAAWLAGGARAETIEGFRERIQEGRRQVEAVDPPMPVYLLYLTAWVDEAGNLQFRDDVYGRNVALRDYFSML